MKSPYKLFQGKKQALTPLSPFRVKFYIFSAPNGKPQCLHLLKGIFPHMLVEKGFPHLGHDQNVRKRTPIQKVKMHITRNAKNILYKMLSGLAPLKINANIGTRRNETILIPKM